MLQAQSNGMQRRLCGIRMEAGAQKRAGESHLCLKWPPRAAGRDREDDRGTWRFSRLLGFRGLVARPGGRGQAPFTFWSQSADLRYKTKMGSTILSSPSISGVSIASMSSAESTSPAYHPRSAPHSRTRDCFPLLHTHTYQYARHLVWFWNLTWGNRVLFYLLISWAKYTGKSPQFNQEQYTRDK